MKSADILLTRMQAQSLLRHEKKSPADIVKSLGGIQGQDYSGGEWSIGVRLPGSTLADIDGAISRKEIVRTWAMRGTLHFLAAADIRWMLELLAPRMIARLGRRYSDLGLETKTFTKAEALLAKSLEGGNQLTRKELVGVLEKNGISCEGQRAAFILHRASLDRVICFGVKRGKKETHALFEEWVPPTKPARREEALGELARRYFTGHGPATLQDYMWWSGLRAADANTGLEAASIGLKKMYFDGKTYWMRAESRGVKSKAPVIHFLPPFDSFLVGYKDRGASIQPAVLRSLRTGGLPDATILVDGKVAGSWKRTIRKDAVAIETRRFRRFDPREENELEAAVCRYADFVGKEPEWRR